MNKTRSRDCVLNVFTMTVTTLIITLVVITLSCTNTTSVQAQETVDVQTQEPAEGTPIPDKLKVPATGTTAEYLAFLDAVTYERCPGSTQAEVEAWQAQAASAQLQTADLILGRKTSDPDSITTEMLHKAALVKLNTLGKQVRYGNPDTVGEVFARLEGLCRQVRDINQPDMIESIESQVFNLRIQSAIANQDKATFVQLVDKFINQLESSGAKTTVTQAWLGQSICQYAVYVDGGKLEPELFQRIGTLLSRAEDPVITRLGRSMLGSRRRLELKGKPMIVAGKNLDGTDFNYDRYRGKVVLVQFWATWCGPCCGEIPHLKKMYDRYHDRGFEIIGISLDRDLNKLIEFIEEREVPWAHMAAWDTVADGQPMSDYYGVSAIPCLILVGKDGNVLSIEARGAVLEKLLSEQFPDEQTK